eukprot:jgi/Tetstr1/422831/TSEL_013622.t1
MVGAPGYSSGRSVLVVIPNSEAVVRASDLATVWAVFEKAGVLTTFATLDSSSPSIESEDGVLIPEDAQHRLEVGVNLSRARSFKGVSFDAVVILGEDPRETSTASLDREVLLKPSRVTDIVTAAVKGNKCVAACGDGVLALAPAKFRDKPILYRKSIAATKEVAAALSRCDIEHFLNDGAAKAEVQAPELGAGAKPVAAVNKDRRLFTTARPQGLEALCKAVKDAITSPDYGATIIQPYLQ